MGSLAGITRNRRLRRHMAQNFLYAHETTFGSDTLCLPRGDAMRIAVLALVLGSLCLVACDDNNDEVVAPGSRTGKFVLQTLNGHDLPVIVADTITAPLVAEVTSGAIALGPNNGFIDVTGFRLSLGRIVETREVACTGTFTVSRDSLRFVESGSMPDCGHTFSGVLIGNTLTVRLRGVPVVYVR
jgi:hypothetical protein